MLDNIERKERKRAIPLNIDITNFVVISGEVSNEVKSAFTKQGLFYLSFVLGVPKGKFLSPESINYIPCTMYGYADNERKVKDILKNTNQGDWVKIIGKINTYKISGDTKYQVIIEELNLLGNEQYDD